MWKLLLITAVFASNLPAHSLSIHDGGGVSMGSDLLRDGINPWWLQNTSEVKYCVEVDSSTFSASQEKIEKLIEKALYYWKTQFSIQNKKENIPLIATQTFIKSTCPEAKLNFKFGLGTLKTAEKSYVPEPERTVGLAVRVDYDPVNLVGKGFIYIASDKLKDRKIGILNGVEVPWKYDGLLYWILVHELGHIFGIPHVATFPLSGAPGVMAHNFADILLSKDYYEKYLLVPEKILPDFWTGGSYWQNCGLKDESWNWLETSGLCILTHSMDRDNMQMMVQSHLGIPALYGSIKNIKFESKRTEPTVMVQLTPENILFQNLKVPFLMAIGFSRSDYSGVLVANGKERPVQFEISEKGLKLYGVSGEKPILVLNR